MALNAFLLIKVVMRQRSASDPSAMMELGSKYTVKGFSIGRM